MGQTVDRSMLAGIGLVMAVLVVNAGIAYRNTQQLDEDATWVAHTHEVMDLTSEVLLALVDAETGERGFLITGDKKFLQPYDAALVRLDEQVTRLKEKTQDNEPQQERIEQLQKMIGPRLAQMQQGIELRNKNAEDARVFMSSNKGKERMDEIRALVADMKQEEAGLLKDRELRSKHTYWLAVFTGFVTALMGLVSLGAFVWLFQRSFAARQKAAAAIEEQREWLRVTLASVGDAVIATDTQGRVVLLNPVTERLTGWQQQDAEHQPLEVVFRIVNEHTRQTVENPVSRALREGKVVGLANHTVLISKDGGERSIDDSAAPIKDEQGKVIGVVLIFRDVTERRIAETALKRNEERLRLFVEHTPAAVAMLDRDMGYLLVSRRWLTDYGLGDQDLRGRSHYEVFPRLPERWKDIHRRCLSGAVEKADEDSFTGPNGQMEWVRWEVRPWRDDRGEVGGILFFSEIITEWKRTQQTIREQAKMLSGILAAPSITFT